MIGFACGVLWIIVDFGCGVVLLSFVCFGCLDLGVVLACLSLCLRLVLEWWCLFVWFWTL